MDPTLEEQIREADARMVLPIVRFLESLADSAALVRHPVMYVSSLGVVSFSL